MATTAIMIAVRTVPAAVMVPRTALTRSSWWQNRAEQNFINRPHRRVWCQKIIRRPQAPPNKISGALVENRYAPRSKSPSRLNTKIFKLCLRGSHAVMAKILEVFHVEWLFRKRQVVTISHQAGSREENTQATLPTFLILQS